MRIYVDFDDCLCETAKALADITARLFGKVIAYEDIRFFDLRDSFGLTEEEYRELMIEAHRPEILFSFEEIPGAVKALNDWMDLGNEVFVITGRPLASSEVSRRWLDEHGLKRARMYFLDKYGRDLNDKDNELNLEPEDFYKMHFDYAVEDSPVAFKFFEHLPDMKVMVFDRPWNRDCTFPNGNYSRCTDWEMIRERLTADCKK
ncbi:MAG: 2-dehydropantoate 2-reductase [Lachnospiraceae bacterium]|nr:2-dehydropantoate 2-reductase [Lachnospiraceae bacterium]